MKQFVPTVPAMLLAAAVCGCASSQHQAALQAEQAALQAEHAALQAEQQAAQEQTAALRAEHVRQNWSKLHAGLTFDKVEQLVGPFDARSREMERITSEDADYFNSHKGNFKGQMLPVSSKMTVIGEHYVLTFEAGNLKSWTLR